MIKSAKAHSAMSSDAHAELSWYDHGHCFTITVYRHVVFSQFSPGHEVQTLLCSCPQQTFCQRWWSSRDEGMSEKGSCPE